MAHAAEPLKELYVVQSKPPQVVVLDAVSGKSVASIPLQPDPQDAIFNGRRRILYVLHFKHGSYDNPTRHWLEPVDMGTRRSLQPIELGPGVPWWHAPGVSRLTMSQDEGRLFYFDVGGAMRAKKPRVEPGGEGVVYVVDARTNALTATYRLDGTSADDFFSSPMGDRVFMLSAGRGQALLGHKGQNHDLVVFGEGKTTPLSTLHLGCQVITILASSDQKRLFLLGRDLADPKSDNELIVIDAQEGSILSRQKVGTEAREIVSRPDGKSYWLVGLEQMRALSDEGVLLEDRIPLNRMNDSKKYIGNVEGMIGGHAGEVLVLNESRAAIVIHGDNGAPLNKLALVNLSEKRVAEIVETGREGIRVGRKLESIAEAVISNPIFEAEILNPQKHVGLAKSSDGQTLYALNSASNDITVINTQDGSVSSRVPLDQSVFRIWNMNKLLWGIGNTAVDVVNTETNKVDEHFKLKAGKPDTWRCFRSQLCRVGISGPPSAALLDVRIDEGQLMIQGPKKVYLFEGTSGQRLCEFDDKGKAVKVLLGR
jgi:DNA-binding beta-propeller fold protein YncE